MAAKQFFLPYAAATINAVAEPGAQLAFYTSGTLNKLPVYATSALTTELSNPVVANSAGRFPNIYLNDALTYRLRILDRNGAELDDIDPFTPGGLLFDITTNAVTPQLYGAVADGVTDDSAAFVAAIAALKAEALNTGGGGFYKGSRSLFIPAGHYYLGTTTLDINHTLAIQGEGSGQLGPAGGGCSRLRWAAGTNGIRSQGPNTSGNTTVDITTHDGSGGVTLNDLCIEGGFAGTEGDYHGLVVRNAVKATNLYIKNWQGEGVKAWAGNVIGFGNVGGNVSTSLFVGVKCEGNRGGFDIRGGDANVVTTINCEGYNCRQFGYLDDNGAGSNTVIGMHCPDNGIVTGTWPQTQCSYSGNRYALKWGGDPTVAPSGTTTDTANWLYIEAGGAITNTIPAWVNTPNTFRAGGDYLTLNTAGVSIINCYSEAGGFSQFNWNTTVTGGTIGPQYHRAVSRLGPEADGYVIRFNSLVGGSLFLATGIGETGFFARDLAGTTFGYADFVQNGGAYYSSHTGHNFRIDGTTVSSIDSSGHYSVGANQVVGARDTGWTADTGTAKKTATATYVVGSALTVGAAYVQAEVTAIITRQALVEAALRDATQEIKALKDLILTHGLAGA